MSVKRFTKRELAALKQTLEVRQSVQDFENRLQVQPYSEQLFSDPSAKFLKEAIIAATVARCLRATSINLIADQWPDFELEVGGEPRKFEVTVADVPDRKIGLEYRNVESSGISIEDDPAESWAKRAAKIPGALKVAAEKKAEKGYPSTADLLIYLNINEYGTRQRQVEAVIGRCTEVSKARFRRVWVLWKEKLYLVWEDGMSQNRIYSHPNPIEMA